MECPGRRWEEEQEAEVRRRDAMKLADDERETILQVSLNLLTTYT